MFLTLRDFREKNRNFRTDRTPKRSFLFFWPKNSKIPLYSTVTGALISGNKLDEKYWWHNLRNTVLFKEEEEKFLFEKINEIRKYLSSTIRKENYDQVIEILADAKLTTDNFFNKVTVNDKNLDVKKNRLELLKMFCNTYNNFIDFSKVEGA